MGLSLVVVPSLTNIAKATVLGNEFLDIQAIVECRFTLNASAT